MTTEANSHRFDTVMSSLRSNTTVRDVGTDGQNTSTLLVVFSHEVPNGGIQELIRRLHCYSKLSTHPILGRFLDQCVSVLRMEIQKLPREQRQHIPPFSNLITLASHWEQLRNGPLGGTWEGAFVCIYELAVFIGYHEARDIPYTVGACLVGVSIGLFSAAAVAASQSLTDLVLYGAESVRIAFAFCLHVRTVSQLLEDINHAKDSTSLLMATWAAVIKGLSAEVVQAELDRFNGQQDSSYKAGLTTALTKISISHVDHTSVGITGPPTRLTELFRQSKTLGSSRHTALPITGGLCHVPNVYNGDDVRAIMTAARAGENWGCRAIHQPLISPYTGTTFPARDFGQLIEAICTEALTKPLFFDKIATGAAAHISTALTQQNMEPSCQVFYYQTSVLTDTIMTTVVEKLPPSITVKYQDLINWAMEDEPGAAEYDGVPGLLRDSKLAVVGMACRMPGDADTPEKFWELLVQGRDTHTVVPSDRFDLGAHFDPSGETENATGTQFGNFISNPGHFDAGFFNMSPREAQQTDPMQRLALVTAYEALEMAGFVPNRTPSSHTTRVGTYYGQASDDYREVNASQKIGTYGIPGTERAFGNGRINYFFNFQGPSFNIDTACSSGLAAVHMACSALWAGEADTVVAGGLNIITSPDIYCMLGKGHFLSQTGQCKVWDAGADGYCRGDGVGSVVIKRLEDALADNDVVLGTIIASATNHSAESISITQPHAGAQRDNYRQVMDKAGVRPLDVSFVELHGTGTQVGDAVESESVFNFFAPLGQRQRPEQRLHMGAVKSNIGHGEAAAGIASLIKVLLMYRHGTIPRHIGIRTTMNPVVEQQLADRNANVLFENTPWVSAPDAVDSTKKRYAIVNSFGAHGGNTTLLLEDAPPSTPTDQEAENELGTLTCEVVCLSAKSKASLRGNVSALLRYLEERPETRLKDLAYTTSARRMHHHIRIAASVSNTEQLRNFLQAAERDLDVHARHVTSTAPKVIAFAFSGQGCFYRGAGFALFERAPEFRETVLRLDRVVRQLGFPSILPAITNRGRGIPRSARSSSSLSSCSDADYATVGSTDNGITDCASLDEAISETPLVTQLSLVVLQIALAQYWQFLGITPSIVIGHSLGEYAAMCTAGVLSVADTLFLVGKRAELMMAACEPRSHAMMSIRGASARHIANFCHGSETKFRYEVSCINGREDTVVSGTQADLHALRDTLLSASPGLQCMLFDVPFAFHSSELDTILDDFETTARRTTFKTPRIPVLSPLLGKVVTEGQIFNAAYVRRATREPVDFESTIRVAEAEGVIDSNTVWIDIGPHPVCTSFVRNCREQGATIQAFPSLRKADDGLAAWSGSLAALHCIGLPVAWNEYFARNEKAHRLLPLETYYWNQKNYWIPYEGTWTLTKAHPPAARGTKHHPLTKPSFFTSSLQKVDFEDLGGRMARMTAISNIFHPDLLGVAAGHKINGRSVLTASIWADIGLTAGENLYKRLVPDAGRPHMDLRNMEVFEAQVVSDEPTSPGADRAQFIRVEALLDMSRRQTQVSYYTAGDDGARKTDQVFAKAVVHYEDLETWQAEWQMASHLVVSRIDTVWTAACGHQALTLPAAGQDRVSLLSQGVAYQLFSNVVDYGVPYRGMRRVALVEDALEAAADIVLDAGRHGTWNTPPHWIDSAFQLAGFVMNAFGVKASDGYDDGNGDDGRVLGSSRDCFYITPGWRHLRMAEPLEAGPHVAYRNYVRMSPVDGEAGAYVGDIYLLRGARIVGVCAGIKFKRVPRALMPIMFPQRSTKKRGSPSSDRPVQLLSGFGSGKQVATVTVSPQGKHPMNMKEPSATPEATESSPPKTTNAERRLPRVTACIQLIANETGLDVDDLSAEAAFAELGIDSLMSLTLAAKMQAELDIPVKASVFLECSTVHEFEQWLGNHGS
ncbi:polyketide synthase [Colletotrichum zoysiae]|uniref:Polyketide synthase n=1 Tax=Colletotrichum zoysiae TaxID=1216348 RepID=A0AAD9HBH2_9PEZI|nr:polyketide synthase [Colletotrichum zoysiae]